MSHTRTLRRQAPTKPTLTAAEAALLPSKVGQKSPAAANYRNARRAGLTHPERREMRDPHDRSRVIVELDNAVIGRRAA